MALTQAAKFSVGFLCLLTLGLPGYSVGAQEKPSSLSPTAKDNKKAPAKTQAPKPAAPVTTVLASVLYSSKWMLVRIEQHIESAAAENKSSKRSSKKQTASDTNLNFVQYYLSQSKGRFLDYPPTDNIGNDFGIQISPDGKQAAFYSDRSGALNLWMMNIDGSDALQITHSDIDIVQFDESIDDRIQFSPDGKKIAFVMLGRAWNYDIQIQNLVTLSAVDSVSTLAWTKDGLSVVYISGASVRKVQQSGSKDKVILADVSRWPALLLKKNSPSEFFYVGDGIYSGDIDSHQSNLVAATAIVPNHPQLSPDEKFIAYIAESPEFRRELFLLNLSGKSSKKKKDENSSSASSQITQGGATYPLFAPSGNSLFFLRGNLLWAIHTDGSAPRPLTSIKTTLPIVAQLSPLGVQP